MLVTADRVSERRFWAMGSVGHLVVVGPVDDGLLDRAIARIQDLEQRWTRFHPTSELARLNRAEGRPVIVSRDTFDLLQLAVAAWQRTDHRFDPSVLGALEAAGYDRTYDDLPAPDEVATVRRAGGAAPGCADIDLDPITRSVMLPPGVGLDLGGIGKGRAADLVVTWLLETGSAGACVNLGGDVRVAGAAPGGAGWIVGIDDPFRPGTTACTVGLLHGAVVTSATTKRRWSQSGRVRHHLIDPANGKPTESGLAAVSVIGADATSAEVAAKAALIAGPVAGAQLLIEQGYPALMTDVDGGPTRLGDWKDFER